jgi:hypothetical protein
LWALTAARQTAIKMRILVILMVLFSNLCKICASNSWLDGPCSRPLSEAQHLRLGFIYPVVRRPCHSWNSISTNLDGRSMFPTTQYPVDFIISQQLLRMDLVSPSHQSKTDKLWVYAFVFLCVASFWFQDFTRQTLSKDASRLMIHSPC